MLLMDPMGVVPLEKIMPGMVMPETVDPLVIDVTMSLVQLW